MKQAPLAHLLLFVLMAAAAADLISSSRLHGEGPLLMDEGRFLAALRAAGMRAKRDSRIEQPFFSVTGTVITVNDEDVQLFQYPDAKAMEAQAALVSPNGSAVGMTKMHWMGPPHFFKKEKLLVLYIGSTESLLSALEAVLGPSFAGHE